jgi:phosphonate transport system permease protein
MAERFRFVGYWQKITLVLWCLAIACFVVADTEIISLDPWSELHKLGMGFLTPDFFATEYLLQALWQTVSFALLGVILGLIIGGPLALIYSSRWISVGCSVVRSIHELFWALLFLQVFGLSPLTGILAIALPYGATFARVFHDILLQVPLSTDETLPVGSDRISRYFYGRISHVLPSILAYIRYRFECSLRSSAVLGFIGMPTIGFYLETAFKQGNYSEGAALLIIFIVLIGTISIWCRAKLIIGYILAALYWLPTIPDVNTSLLWRFVSQDILPPAMRRAVANDNLDWDLLSRLGSWASRILSEQALPGAIATLVLAISAAMMAHFVAVLLTGLSSKILVGRLFSATMRLLLVIFRSVPEYIYAFIFMMLLGPSMLPAMFALAIHNGALIAFLTTRQLASTELSEHYNQKIDGYCYDVLPKIYPNMMGLLFYRFEVILRETAIFGMLGVATLGFYIDSGFAEIHYSTALLLMGCTALLNIGVDIVSRRLLNNQSASISCMQ